MSENTTIQVFGVERLGQTYFWSYEDGPLEPGHFRVQTLYTGFSAGTELTFYKGTNPFFHSRYDEEYGVFHHDEPATHFPVPFLGYMEVGRVVETKTGQVKVGDVVGMTYGHKTGHTVNAAEEFFVLLPPDLDPILGIYLGQMGPVCANGLLHAAADAMGSAVTTLGDGVRGRNVLVVGGGVVGLLTGLFAVQFGAAAVALADRTPSRLEAAGALGMIPIDETVIEPWRWCKETWHHSPRDRGADVAFQCRANDATLPNALRALRPDSTVIDLAFYEGGQPNLRLGEEFHHNGLAIKCAQVYHQPRALRHQWNRQRLALETLRLLREKGDLIRKHIITDVVPLDDAGALVDSLANYSRSMIQAVFEVSN